MPTKTKPPTSALIDDVRQETDRDMAAIIAEHKNAFTSDRSPVSRADYLAYRRESWLDPKLREQWVAQVGPEEFFKEFFEAFNVPKDSAHIYLEGLKAGLPHDKAMFYADQLHAAERTPVVTAPPVDPTLAAPQSAFAPPPSAPAPGALPPPQLLVGGPPPAPPEMM